MSKRQHWQISSIHKRSRYICTIAILVLPANGGAAVSMLNMPLRHE
jgi:hypothetical protein